MNTNDDININSHNNIFNIIDTDINKLLKIDLYNIENNINNNHYETILNITSNEFDIPIYNSKKKHKKILVLSGGGIKGIAHIGALQKLHELNILQYIEIFAGASVGALISVLYIIGYTPMELWEFVKTFDFLHIINISKTPIIGVTQNYGLDDGSIIEHVIKQLIIAKHIDPNITLKQLFLLTKKKIIFTTVNINKQDICYLSYDDYPNLSLLLAIKMTICIPIYFTPIKYKHHIWEYDQKNYKFEMNDTEDLFIDGGCIDNYPIQLFQDNLNDVLGIYLAKNTNHIKKINNLNHYIILLIETLINGANFNSKKGFDKYTITINIDSVSCIDFKIDYQKKLNIFKCGYETVDKYFK